MSKIPKYKPDDQKSAADVHGPWVDPGIDTGLIQRCRKYWSTPIVQLPNGVLATFLRQRIAVDVAATEASKRIAAGFTDGTELYDDELEHALLDARPKS